MRRPKKWTMLLFDTRNLLKKVMPLNCKACLPHKVGGRVARCFNSSTGLVYHGHGFHWGGRPVLSLAGLPSTELKNPVYSFKAESTRWPSIWDRRDLNPRPLGLQSSTLTARPHGQAGEEKYILPSTNHSTVHDLRCQDLTQGLDTNFWKEQSTMCKQGIYDYL